MTGPQTLFFGTIFCGTDDARASIFKMAVVCVHRGHVKRHAHRYQCAIHRRPLRQNVRHNAAAAAGPPAPPPPCTPSSFPVAAAGGRIARGAPDWPLSNPLGGAHGRRGACRSPRSGRSPHAAHAPARRPSALAALPLPPALAMPRPQTARAAARRRRPAGSGGGGTACGAGRRCAPPCIACAGAPLPLGISAPAQLEPALRHMPGERLRCRRRAARAGAPEAGLPRVEGALEPVVRPGAGRELRPACAPARTCRDRRQGRRIKGRRPAAASDLRRPGWRPARRLGRHCP